MTEYFIKALIRLKNMEGFEVDKEILSVLKLKNKKQFLAQAEGYMYEDFMTSEECKIITNYQMAGRNVSKYKLLDTPLDMCELLDIDNNKNITQEVKTLVNYLGAINEPVGSIKGSPIKFLDILEYQNGTGLKLNSFDEIYSNVLESYSFLKFKRDDYVRIENGIFYTSVATDLKTVLDCLVKNYGTAYLGLDKNLIDELIEVEKIYGNIQLGLLSDINTNNYLLMKLLCISTKNRITMSDYIIDIGFGYTKIDTDIVLVNNNNTVSYISENALNEDCVITVSKKDLPLVFRKNIKFQTYRNIPNIAFIDGKPLCTSLGINKITNKCVR